MVGATGIGVPSRPAKPPMISPAQIRTARARRSPEERGRSDFVALESRAAWASTYALLASLVSEKANSPESNPAGRFDLRGARPLPRRLVYIGHVGTGFTTADRRALRQQLNQIEQPTSPLELRRPRAMPAARTGWNRG